MNTGTTSCGFASSPPWEAGLLVGYLSILTRVNGARAGEQALAEIEAAGTVESAALSQFVRTDPAMVLFIGAALAILQQLTGIFSQSTAAKAAQKRIVINLNRIVLARGKVKSAGYWLQAPVTVIGFAQATAPAKRGGLAASATDFDDSGWRPVDLPHDWAVGLGFVDDPKVVVNGFKPLGRAYPGTSIGWYRRVFDIPSTDLGRRTTVEFEGVFCDCEVAADGYNLGRHEGGYTPFHCDLTDFLNYGGKNALVVRADATQFEGWRYEGAGIYRHVWLAKTHPAHIAQWGTHSTGNFCEG